MILIATEEVFQAGLQSVNPSVSKDLSKMISLKVHLEFSPLNDP